jgi:hypothetical protein
VLGEGVNGRSVGITFRIDRYTTEIEHTAALAALDKGGALALHTLFATSPDIGAIIVAGETIPLKYAYRRPQSSDVITLLADAPGAIFGAVTDKDERGQHAADFTLAILDFSLPGFGAGEIDPAVTLSFNESGQIMADSYDRPAIRLKNLTKQ